MSHLGRVQASELSDKLSKKVDETKRSLENAKKDLDESIAKVKSENLQMLGFFTAIISFTIGSLNILGNRSFMESALLIIILSGSLILVFNAFSIIFPNKSGNSNKIIWISMLAIIAILGSIGAYIFIR